MQNYGGGFNFGRNEKKGLRLSRNILLEMNFINVGKQTWQRERNVLIRENTYRFCSFKNTFF